jgi:DNA-binding transcriptional MerR regulator
VQELGFSLREIGASLSEANKNLPSKPDMLESLRTKLSSVDENIERLSRRRTLMAALVGELEIEC